MFICLLETVKEVEVRLVGQIGERTDGYIYGVAFLDPNIDFWNVAFPPPGQFEKQASRMVLECRGCRNHEAVNLDALELDVYAVNQGILRYCKRCLLQTIWKQVRDAVLSEPAAPPAPPDPQPEVSPVQAPQPENRRRDVRAKVNLMACVRYSGSDEVVVCENMSRGGVCFKSHKHYPEKSMIEIAAPYSPGSQSIFVSAQILHVMELTNEKVFRCGVAYVKSPGVKGEI
ncbi:MAG: PilZ domain-containing protein [Candidatus Acidiferrales bacterium]